MITRRALMSTAIAGLVAHPALAAPPAPNDPVAILTAIYTRAAKGKGDGGAAFVIEAQGREGKIFVEIADRLMGQGRCPYREGRRRPGGF